MTSLFYMWVNAVKKNCVLLRLFKNTWEKEAKMTKRHDGYISTG